MSAPNWKYWIAKRFVKGWQAAALSLDIDPYALHRHPEFWAEMVRKPVFPPNAFRDAGARHAFDERYELIDTYTRASADKNARTNYLLLSETDLHGFAAWLVMEEFDVPPELATLSTKPAPHDDTVDPMPQRAAEPSPSITVGVAAGKNAAAVWQAEARRVADELHRRDKKAGAHSSLSDLADRVAEDFRQRGIEGARTPLSGGYILREALQSGRWTRPVK